MLDKPKTVNQVIKEVIEKAINNPHDIKKLKVTYSDTVVIDSFEIEFK